MPPLGLEGHFEIQLRAIKPQGKHNEFNNIFLPLLKLGLIGLLILMVVPSLSQTNERRSEPFILPQAQGQLAPDRIPLPIGMPQQLNVPPLEQKIPPVLKLTGIIQVNNSMIAIINNSSYGINGIIEFEGRNWRVSNITDMTVQLRHRRNEKTLTLN